MIRKSDKIFVAGHKGLIGSAILRKLKLNGYNNIIIADKKKLNLIDQKKVFLFLKKNKPKFIFLAAAKVGGIYSNNKYKAEFIYENLMIQNNIIHGAFKANIKNSDSNIVIKTIKYIQFSFIHFIISYADLIFVLLILGVILYLRYKFNQMYRLGHN